MDNKFKQALSKWVSRHSTAITSAILTGTLVSAAVLASFGISVLHNHDDRNIENRARAELEAICEFHNCKDENCVTSFLQEFTQKRRYFTTDRAMTQVGIASERAHHD